VNLLYIMLIAVMVLVLLLFITAMKVIFIFNSDKANINLTLLWLYPFLKVVVTTEETHPVLVAYLFGKSIVRRDLRRKPTREKRRKTNRVELVRQIKPRDVHVHASYGFRDPSITGVACGAMNMAAQFIHIDSFNNDPDFVAENDYIYVDATAKLNPGITLVKLIKAYFRNSTKRVAYQNR
jgi:membrane protein implicated in regulation of membrane protease activity